MLVLCGCNPFPCSLGEESPELFRPLLCQVGSRPAPGCRARAVIYRTDGAENLLFSGDHVLPRWAPCLSRELFFFFPPSSLHLLLERSPVIDPPAFSLSWLWLVPIAARDTCGIPSQTVHNTGHVSVHLSYTLSSGNRGRGTRGGNRAEESCFGPRSFFFL